jgi:hypothetical protein
LQVDAAVDDADADAQAGRTPIISCERIHRHRTHRRAVFACVGIRRCRSGCRSGRWCRNRRWRGWRDGCVRRRRCRIDATTTAAAACTEKQPAAQCRRSQEPRLRAAHDIRPIYHLQFTGMRRVARWLNSGICRKFSPKQRAGSSGIFTAVVSDSRSVLAKEADMDGPSFIA